MHLFFDLDGTLTDSRVGVTRCIQHALLETGVEAPGLEGLTRYVGPPLPASFAALLGTSDARRIDEAIASYRRRYESVGMFENVLYSGVEEMLEHASADGHEMCVVTAKPHVYARRILEHFDVARLFRGVYGPELGARQYTKESLIREACATEKAPPALTIMIGDRAEDIIGARGNGVHSVGVAWGYGSREELEAATPSRIVASPDELVEYIRQGVQRVSA